MNVQLTLNVFQHHLLQIEILNLFCFCYFLKERQGKKGKKKKDNNNDLTRCDFISKVQESFLQVMVRQDTKAFT